MEIGCYIPVLFKPSLGGRWYDAVVPDEGANSSIIVHMIVPVSAILMPVVILVNEVHPL